MKFISSGMLFAIASMMLMGVSTFIYKKSTLALGATNATFYYYLFNIVIAMGVWLFFREERQFACQSLLWPLRCVCFLW
jgi:ABC-type nickel/cobalt efflux system permease component RcnA|tara:strand:+ start:227 stop:463 length:237 start_codon:yes stop_codon:yes gene_type:complete